MTTNLDALEALAAELDNFGAGTHEYAMPEFVGESADAMFALIVELRQERERADAAVKQQKLLVAEAEDLAQRLVNVGAGNMELLDALSRAEETIEAIRVARGNHPECDVHDADDPVTCGWKRAVQDIDAALTEYGKQKGASDG